ncbi:predicted protein [Naegleria gruberi]|uniref:Predicted protein n=1 Tax=Naegleria gruberi TaxID=5762 RepID=D2VWS0_NAEGR|nr:uncharacterized protein NAEGRDRAFT_73481 [Naegleria gruberi]EFC38743.1 predicted protein [Naegleria gruberi]|eukprot:XP_002671487.1 predicted protein [Naegleria gruberi strain NEG-M]
MSRAFETVNVYVSGVIPNVSASTVWSLIGSFNGLPTWYDTVASSEMDNNQSDNTVGGIRKLTMKNGIVQRERLIAMDLRNSSYTYSLVDGIPWEGYNNDYFATISVKSITTNGTDKLDNTLLEWKAEFTCPHGEGKKWQQAIEGIFEYGIKCLQNIYNK